MSDLSDCVYESFNKYKGEVFDTEVVLSSMDNYYKISTASSGIYLCSFYISPFPGNGKIFIFHGVDVYKDFRGNGIGTVSHKIRLEAVKMYGGNICMATVRKDNQAENKIMKKFQWIPCHENWEREFTVWMIYL